jgi:hypothetical protein
VLALALVALVVTFLLGGRDVADVAQKQVARRGAAGVAKSRVASRGVSGATSLASCLANEVVKLDGTYHTEYRDALTSPRTTFDARTATFDSYPFTSLYPFGLGKTTAPTNVCVLGGLVRGRQPRTLTWQQMKTHYDGDALRIAGNDWYIIDGLRVDNVEDGVAPRGTDEVYPKDGDGFVLRNLYMTYIRDDCVENDDIAGGLIYDSLFDGCYTGISERPTDGNAQWNHPAPAGETLTLDHVLLRLQAMPGPYESAGASIFGHGQLFKWSNVANELVIRDSVFLVERKPNSPSYFPFPAGTITQNVTIVWLGGGKFKWKVPPGTRVVTDRAVWDSARADWLNRHGCTSFFSCAKLLTPDPFAGG